MPRDLAKTRLLLGYAHSVGVRVARSAVPILVLSVFAAWSCGPDSNIAQSSGDTTVKAARTGAELFAANCAACHGADGEGQPNWHLKKADGTLPAPPLNGDGHTWHHGDGLLYQIVSQGGKTLEDPRDTGFKSAMPEFGNRLSHEEIIEVLTYVKSLWGDKTMRDVPIRESQAFVSQQDPFPPAGE